MGSMSPLHWLLVLLVILLLFGTNRLSSVMGDFAKGIKAFKKNMAEDESMEAAIPPRPIQAPGVTATVQPPAQQVHVDAAVHGVEPAPHQPGMTLTEAAASIIRAGHRMDQRGWVPATAGNISARLGPNRIAITRSGGHKGFLTEAGIMEVDEAGAALTPGARPSAETRLHCQIYQAFPDAGAVLHGHSVANTVLSMAADAPALHFTGYEVQKIFAGQTTHEATLTLPIYPNDQDMPRLAARIAPDLPRLAMGYVIQGHGVYIWGPDMDSALARLEGLEFLLACALARKGLPA